MLGAVEPRKRQVEVVRTFQRLSIARRARLTLHIIGSLHHLVASEFRTLIEGDSDIVYSGYASDQEITDAFAAARFSIFASEDEGFGLPITEA